MNYIINPDEVMPMMEKVACINVIVLFLALIAILYVWIRWARRTQRRWPDSRFQEEKIDFSMKVKRPTFYILAIAVLVIIGVQHYG
ncbi:hypothetical protein LMG33818_000368 [Halomonadaceae bacterium LMG 33818]|uniref:hypothetical protein n=1 Tax=Cernens ardua TaxID=3402176 RepID=UPI003EDCAD0C